MVTTLVELFWKGNNFFFKYNKSKGKPHPFETCGELDWDVIKEKLAKLKERAATDEVFAAALARESGDDATKIKFGITGTKNNTDGRKNA